MVMRIKYIIGATILVLSIHVYGAHNEDLRKYCDPGSMRLLDEKIPLEEEFSMLLDPMWTPNFSTVVNHVRILLLVPLEELHDEVCPIHYHAQEFLAYYDKYKDGLSEDKKHIKDLIEVIREKVFRYDEYVIASGKGMVPEHKGWAIFNWFKGW